MYESGKVHNIIKEMKRLDIQIMGIGETWWPNTGQCNIQDHEVYHSGNTDSRHKNGVGVIVTGKVKQYVKYYTRIRYSDRMLLLRLNEHQYYTSICSDG